MPIFPEAPIRLHVVGTVRERVLDGLASVAVDADGVLVAPLDAALQAAGVVRIPFELLEGVEHDEADGGTLVLLLTLGGRVTAVGDRRVREVARDVLTRGRALPEVTRAVRALGSGHGGAEKEAFFAPLLRARRQATGGWPAALDAFDADALRQALDHALARMAEAREPHHAAARRALEACLCDAAEPLLQALPRVREAADAARHAGDARALRAWREWVHAVRVMFERADAAWPLVQVTLDTLAREARPAPRVGLQERLRLPRIR